MMILNFSISFLGAFLGSIFLDLTIWKGLRNRIDDLEDSQEIPQNHAKESKWSPLEDIPDTIKAPHQKKVTLTADEIAIKRDQRMAKSQS